MHLPLVTIIIPIYNGAKYMREAIDSALGQTYQNIEIVVVNDGSTDNTHEIAQTYGNKIRYFSKENGGVATALNRAIQESRGEYISWLSHDDVYYPHKIHVQVDLLRELSQFDCILYSNFEHIDEKSKCVDQVILDHEDLVSKPDYALLRSAISGCTLLIPRVAFEDCGYFDEDLVCTQDYAKWFEMQQRYTFIHVEDVLVKQRLHSLQDTNTNPLVISEGNRLWIDMVAAVTPERAANLEGSLISFYYEQSKFLATTPYVGALQFTLRRISECFLEKVGNKTVISIISSGKWENLQLMPMIESLLADDFFVHVIAPDQSFSKAVDQSGSFFCEDFSAYDFILSHNVGNDHVCTALCGDMGIVCSLWITHSKYVFLEKNSEYNFEHLMAVVDAEYGFFEDFSAQSTGLKSSFSPAKNLTVDDYSFINFMIHSLQQCHESHSSRRKFFVFVRLCRKIVFLKKQFFPRPL